MTSTFVFRCRFEGSFDDASDALLEVQCSPDVSWSNDGAGWMMGGSRFGGTLWGPVLAFSLGGAESRKLGKTGALMTLMWEFSAMSNDVTPEGSLVSESAYFKEHVLVKYYI